MASMLWLQYLVVPAYGASSAETVDQGSQNLIFTFIYEDDQCRTNYRAFRNYFDYDRATSLVNQLGFMMHI